MGELSAEYSIADSAMASPQTPRVSYMTDDHLGSPRIVTDANGAVVSRKDFAAFGDETLTSQRTPALGYNAPDIRQDYTGYLKDNESGLEYAQARYYNSQPGRFTSVDPLTASATIRNPQSFNRYSYAINSPYKFTDPLGLAYTWCGSEHGSCDDGFAGGNSNDAAADMAAYDQRVQKTHEDMQNREQAEKRLASGAWVPGSGMTEVGGQAAAVGAALLNMLKSGNVAAQRIASNIVNSIITIDVTNAAQAFTGVISPTNLASAIKAGNVSFKDAMGYLQIGIPQSEFTNATSPQAAIESTLVHEGTHAESMATAIVSVSIGGNFDRSMVDDEYRAKVNAAQYEVDKGGVYLKHGQASNTKNDVTPGQGLINNAGKVNFPLIQSIANGEPGTVRSRLGIGDK